jgi:hypothetical protein
MTKKENQEQIQQQQQKQGRHTGHDMTEAAANASNTTT